MSTRPVTERHGWARADGRPTPRVALPRPPPSPAQRLRTDCSDGDADMEAGFYILRKSACPAVLTENLFMDNRDDMAFLLSDEGRRAVVGLHVDGIVNYLKFLKL